MSPTALLWLVRLASAGVVLAVLWWAVVMPRQQLAAERQAHAETKAANAAVLRDLAEKTAEVARQVRERETQFTRDASESDARHAQELSHAQAVQDRIAADLRAERIRLRQWWQDRPVSCLGDAAAPADPTGDAERAGLRAASVGRVVGVGARADAWIGWLQRELIATRAACGVTP